jgi:long-subunit fatty acid transport protein
VNGIAQSVYTGNGGLTKLYASLSYNLFQGLSLGVNVGYLFGNIINSGQTTPITNTGTVNFVTLWNDTLHSNTLVYDAGLQYSIPAGANKTWVLGIVFSPKIKLNGTVGRGVLRINPSTGAIQDNAEHHSSKDSIFELPETYGFGFTYNVKNKLTAGADIQYQKWGSAKFYDRTDSLSNRLKINVGGEYVPDFRSNRFLKRMRYRAGAYYTNSYIKVNGLGYDEYGASVGLGIPMHDRRSFLNFSFDYTKIKPEKNALIDEQYFKITVSYTFNELWFFKRKVQ